VFVAVGDESNMVSQIFLFGIPEDQNLPHIASFWSDLFRVPSHWPPKVPKRLALPLATRHCSSKRFLEHLSLPCLVVDESFFPGGFYHPAGSGSSEIGRTMLPNSRRVR
jgi:hypothetical protein